MLLVPHYSPKTKIGFSNRHIADDVFALIYSHCAGTLSISGSLFLNLKVVFLFWQNCRRTYVHIAQAIVGKQLLLEYRCTHSKLDTPQFCLHAYRKDQAIQNGRWGGGGGGDQWLPLRRLLRPHEEDDLHRLGCLRCHPTSGSHIPRAKSLFCELQVWRIRSTLADIQCAQTSRFTMS